MLQRDGTTRVGTTLGEDKQSGSSKVPNAANDVVEEEVGGDRVKKVGETGKEEF